MLPLLQDLTTLRAVRLRQIVVFLRTLQTVPGYGPATADSDVHEVSTVGREYCSHVGRMTVPNVRITSVRSLRPAMLMKKVLYIMVQLNRLFDGG